MPSLNFQQVLITDSEGKTVLMTLPITFKPAPSIHHHFEFRDANNVPITSLTINDGDVIDVFMQDIDQYGQVIAWKSTLANVSVAPPQPVTVKTAANKITFTGGHGATNNTVAIQFNVDVV